MQNRFLAVLPVFAVVLTLVLATPAWAQTTLSINKTDSPDPVVVGEVLTYTIVVRNTGTEAAENVVVEDILPTGTTFVSANTTEGTCTTPDPGDPGTVTCELGDIPDGEEATVTIRVRPTEVPAGGTITNDATAVADNAPPVTDPATTRVLPDLVITKLDDPDLVKRDGLLLYTLRVTNEGSDFSGEVVVVDDLPVAKVDFVRVESSYFTCEHTGGLVRCERGSGLGADQTRTIEIVVEPEMEGTIQNTATVRAEGVEVDADTESTRVEDNAGGSGGGGGNGGGGNGGGGNGGGGNGGGNNRGGSNAAVNNQYGAGGLGTEDIFLRRGDQVLADTIPNSELPFTGGTPFMLLVAGALLVAGLVVSERVIRRR